MCSLAQSLKPFLPNERNHVMMSLILRERYNIINWLGDNQVEEGVKQFAGEYRIMLLLESVKPN